MCGAPGALKQLPEGGARAEPCRGKRGLWQYAALLSRVEEEETDGASDVIL